MELPSQGRLLKDSKIRSMVQSDAFLVPFYIEYSGACFTFAYIIIYDRGYSMAYYNPRSSNWKYHVQEYGQIHSFETVERGFYSRGVQIFGRGSRDVRSNFVDFGEALESLYKQPMISYDISSQKNIMYSNRPDNCECNSKQESILRTNGADNIPIVTCSDCGSNLGVVYRGNKYSLNKYMDEGSVLSNMAFEDVYSYNDNHFAVLRPSENIETRILVGSFILASNNEFSPSVPFDLSSQNYLVSIDDGRPTGIMIWAKNKDGDVLFLQLYIRSMFRRENIAKSMVNLWGTKILDSGTVIVDSPNDKAQKLIDEMKPLAEHLDVNIVERFRIQSGHKEMNEKLWRLLGENAMP